MLFIQIALVTMLLLGLTVLSACTKQANQSDAKSKQAVTSEQIQAMSREDIQRALKRIESSHTPTSQKMGAMCYEPVAPASGYFEYVCPVDGDKTVFSLKSNAFDQATHLQELRGSVERLRPLAKGIALSLDEGRLCAKCHPALPDAERFVSLVLQYADGRTVRTDRVTPEDLKYLTGFFSGGLSYLSQGPDQEPLKPKVARLKELLGEKGVGT